MKKRLLSLVLCLVMVFSLFPSFAMASTIENVGTDGDYVYVPTDNKAWTTSDDFSSTEYYVKDGDDYYRVTPQEDSSQPYYKTKSLTLKAGSSLPEPYFFYDNGEFRPVQEKTGFLYQAATKETGIKKADHWLGNNSQWSGYCMEHTFSKYKRDAGTFDGNRYAWGWPNESGLFYFDSDNKDIHFLYYNSLARGGQSITNAHWETILFYFNDVNAVVNEPETIPSSSNNYYATSVFSDGTYSDGEMHGDSHETNAAYTAAKNGGKITYLRSKDYGVQTAPGTVYSADGGDIAFWWQGDSWISNAHWYSNGLNGSKITLYTRLPNKGVRSIYYLDANNAEIELGHSPINNSSDYPICNRNDLYVVDSARHASALTYTKDGQSCVVPGSSYLRYDGETTYYTGVLYTREKLGTLGGHKDIAGNPADGYTLTIDSWATGKYQNFVDGGEPTPVDPPAKTPLDIVLVVDQSGSMRTQDLEGGNIQYNSTDKTEWTVAELKNGTQYYYFDGQNYYPVQLGRGTVYRHYGDVRGDWTFGWGNDGISVMVNGAPTYYNVRTFYYVYVDADGDGVKEMHRLRAITAGLDLHYGFYPYIYKDESNEYAQMGKWKDNHYWFRLISPWGANKLRHNDRWNTIIENDLISFLDTNENLLGSSDEACNSAKMNYSWVTSTAKMKDLYVANGRDYADLYYVDANGERHNISTRYFSTDKFDTKTPLYTISGGSSRVSALESAVGQFVDALKTEGADDQIAIVGYAQNSEETTVPAGVKYVGRQSGSYVNTGVFSGTDFKGFTNYDNASYSNALQNVADVNFSADTFGTWGGTYTNYGMAMANKIDGRENAQKVVIFFTDGEPGELGYEHTVAGETLINGAAVKAGADVYTVGLYPQSASDEVKTFLKQLSSEYNTTVTSVPVSDMDPGQTYFVKQGDSYTAISTDYYGESSLGWWEHNADGTYTLMNVKGANAGAGEEYLYTGRDGEGETTGENADTNRTYYSSRNNEVKYEYRWFDAQMNDVVPSGYVYTLSNTRQEGTFSMTASTKAGLEQVFTELAATIRPTDEAAQQPVAPSANGTATNYDKTNSYVQDVISSDFDLGSSYTVTVREVTGVTAYDNEQKAQGTEGPVLVSGNGPSATSGDGKYSYQITGNTIKITGWDFGAGYAENKALRVTITGLTPTVTGTAFSNDSAKSGIYDGDDNKLFSYNNPYINIPTYTVEWSVRGNVVETDAGLAYNAIPNYDGETPANYEEGNTAYTFVGWSAIEGDEASAVPADQLPRVTEDVTYYAVYHEEQIVEYTVHWMNGSAEMASQPTTYRSGAYPSYNGTEPTSATANTYFVGWSKNASFTSVDENTTDAQLKANLYYGAETVDQLDTDGNHDVVLYAVFYTKSVDTQTVVVDYSVKHNIANDVYNYDVVSVNNGTFQLDIPEESEKGTLTYTPNLGMKAGTADLTAMAKASVADYYTGAPASDLRNSSITRVTVVPGSSIYFDDSLEGATAQLVNGKYDYKTALAGLDEGAADAESLSKGESRVIKFNGTRIDVYCTTDNTTNSVYATLKMLDNEGNLIPAVDANKQTIKAKLVSNKFTNGGTMYSTPTVSFDNLDPDNTYVLTLKSMSSMAYRLDGVRIYSATDNSMNGETNAKFVKVRDLLVEGFGSGTLDGETVTGAAFVDKDGFNTASEFATYVDYGPKNEVYLAPGQGIAFQVNTAGYAVPTLMVGLKVKSGTGTAWISNGTGKTVVTLDSVVDQYFTVVPNAQGMVVIKNAATSGNQLIAISNIKITGEAARMTTFAARPAALRSYVASFDALEEIPAVTEEPAPIESPDVEPTESPAVEPSADPDPDPTPTLQDLFKQLFSNFVNRLFGSIGRLFGGN